MIRNLPDSLEERAHLAIKAGLPPQKERLAQYLLAHPGAYTHELAANCAVGYPPNRIMELNREILPDYGLHIECLPPAKGVTNRFGQRTNVHRWKIVKLPSRSAA